MTSTVYKTISQTWNAIREERNNTPGEYSRRILKDSRIAVFVGIKEPSNLLQITFEVSRSSLKHYQLSQSARGFDVSVESRTNTTGDLVCSLTVSLNRPDFADLFLNLCSDIVARAIDEPSEPEAVRSIHDRLIHWRRFSEQVNAEGLSESQQLGLFGELTFLENLLSEDVPEDLVINSWQGPNSQNQDFCFGQTAVEVKATASNNQNEVNVSNVRQLDDTGLEHLFLLMLSFDRREGSGLTLNERIERIASRIRARSIVLIEEFERKLLQAGYHSSQAHLYNRFGYSIRSIAHFKVSDNFPRILERDLPNGVFEIKYRIDLSSAADSRVDPTIVFQSIRTT